MSCPGADSLDQWQWRNPLPTGNILNAVTYGNGRFVAVGLGGVAATSLDGWTWQEQPTGSIPEGTIYYTLSGVACGNGTFVAVGNGQTSSGLYGVILASQDGATWGEVPCPDVVGLLDAVTWGGGQFLAVGYGFDPALGGFGAILTSPDGTNWTAQQLMTSEELSTVAYGNGAYVACSACDVTSLTNAIDWTHQKFANCPFFLSVAYGHGTFVAVGNVEVCTSGDGYTWTNSWPPSQYMDAASISYAANAFVAVGDSGLIATLPDGSKWTFRALGTGNTLRGSAYGDGTWVVVGDGALLVSTNLSAWRNLDSSVTIDDLFATAYGDGLFVAGGARAALWFHPMGFIGGLGWPARAPLRAWLMGMAALLLRMV